MFKKLCLLTMVVVLAWASSCFAGQAYTPTQPTWDGSDSQNWDEPNNWSLGAVPTESTWAFILASSNGEKPTNPHIYAGTTMDVGIIYIGSNGESGDPTIEMLDGQGNCVFFSPGDWGPSDNVGHWEQSGGFMESFMAACGWGDLSFP